MAIDSDVAFVNTNGVAFPNNEAVNATGPTATDGTEFVKNLIDNYMFGPQQALLDHAAIIPSGSVEAAGASQEIEAMQKSFGHPGESVNWYGDSDPAVLGMRVLLLHGQGVLIATYPELTAAVYVGDGNNASAPAFYKADDAAGTIRNTAGIYLILPDARGIYPKFEPRLISSARIDNNGTATITSQGGKDGAGDNAIASVNRSGAGVVAVTFTVGFYSVPPAVNTTQNISSGYFVETGSITTAGFTAFCFLHNGTPDDKNFSVEMARQGADEEPFGTDFIEPGIRY